jgi:hypothetical protein
MSVVASDACAMTFGDRATSSAAKKPTQMPRAIPMIAKTPTKHGIANH